MDQERFKDYTQQRKQKTVEFQDTPYLNTLCSVCNTICHENCGLEQIQVAGDMRFMQCAAFNGNSHCQVCGGETRCNHNNHYHARKKPIVKEETLQEVLQEIKSQYDKATSDLQSNKLQVTKLQDSKKLLENSIFEHSNGILKSCEGIKKICKNFNFAEELQIMVDQLKVHYTELTDPIARAVAQKFIDSVNGIIQSMHQDRSTMSCLPQSRPQGKDYEYSAC
jgi:hypothetical protein